MPESQNPIHPPEANRFGTASGLLHSAFQKLTHRRVEEAKSPITILLDEDQTQLEELALVTSKNLNRRGICTVDLAYTNDNGLTFKVKAAACETNAKFKQVNLSVRLLDIIEPDRFEPPAELTTGTPQGLQVSPNVGLVTSRSRNTTFKTNKITSVLGMKYKKGIQWTLVENTDMGIDGGTFKLWTRRALPLSAEINIFGEYEKKSRVKRIEKPGKNNYLEYRVLLKM